MVQNWKGFLQQMCKCREYLRSTWYSWISQFGAFWGYLFLNSVKKGFSLGWGNLFNQLVQRCAQGWLLRIQLQCALAHRTFLSFLLIHISVDFALASGAVLTQAKLLYVSLLPSPEGQNLLMLQKTCVRPAGDPHGVCLTRARAPQAPLWGEQWQGLLQMNHHETSL